MVAWLGLGLGLSCIRTYPHTSQKSDFYVQHVTDIDSRDVVSRVSRVLMKKSQYFQDFDEC